MMINRYSCFLLMFLKVAAAAAVLYVRWCNNGEYHDL